ncbi:MAG: hypothetical protein ACXWNC_01025 [Anaerolineales bacterium]
MAVNPSSWSLLIKIRKPYSDISLVEEFIPLDIEWNMMVITTVPGALFFEDHLSFKYRHWSWIYVWGEPNGVRELFWYGTGRAGGVRGVGVIVAVALAVASGVFVLTGEPVAEIVGVINVTTGVHAESNIAVMLKPCKMHVAKSRWNNMLGILL